MIVTVTIADDIVAALQARLAHVDRQIVPQVPVDPKQPDGPKQPDPAVEPIGAWLTQVVTQEVLATRKGVLQAQLATEEAKGASADDATVADLLLQERRLTVSK